MVTRILPKKLIKRLKKAAPKIDTRLRRMKNIDPRQGTNPFNQDPTSTRDWGYRIREMNVSRNFPKTRRIVIKRVQRMGIDSVNELQFTAQETIDFIKKRIRDHNRKYKSKLYQLLPLNAYAISKELIAMGKTHGIPVMEILGIGGKSEPTLRGTKFFEKIQRKHNLDGRRLLIALVQIRERTEITPQNLVLVGYRNGKFVFAPLADEY
ncbi:MAG: hypothetical protein Q7S92_02195 [Candidatus Diapherotrites archaeon]|nr:hypothetical protein [Candidatus Diapherotrites archaeon]